MGDFAAGFIEGCNQVGNFLPFVDDRALGYTTAVYLCIYAVASVLGLVIGCILECIGCTLFCNCGKCSNKKREVLRNEFTRV